MILRLPVLSLIAILLLQTGSAAESGQSSSEVATLLQPNRSPLVSFRILFRSGSAYDPAGKEGIAALTASLLAKGGTRTQSYEQIVEAMYPMATSFSSQVDKEMTVFTGTTHVDNLEGYYSLIREMLLDPGFRAEDFTRLKTEAINFLKVSLREANDEELGKEQLYHLIYSNHPYAHHTVGSLSALEKLTVDDVRTFYKAYYKLGSVVLGLAGGFPQDFPERVKKDFSRLPPGRESDLMLPPPRTTEGTWIEIIQRETRSTAISLGFPIDLKRGDPDWPALALVVSYFGQHRSSNSHLYQRLREVRGLNYGDYAYLEYFPRGMYQFQPDPNLARHQQIFQIWVRPVEPQQGHFALRAALHEYDKLVREGLSQEIIEATREFLTKHVNVLLQTQDARLGYALDSRFYGIPEFDTYLRDQLAKLTVADVNRAIRQHLKSNRMHVVMVTKEAEALRDAIVSDKPSPITYNSPKPQEILEEDKLIEKYPINVRTGEVKVRPVVEVFE